tara:strand:+ start:357 stop:785 length:429 start_codon:yes stop_codon:yes gene_type:complete
MLVYLTSANKSKNMEGYQSFYDALSFSNSVKDNEATAIVCEDFLCSFSFEDLGKIIDLIVRKMRLKCKLTINEKDMQLISRQVYRESADLELLNKAIFSKKIILKSLLSADLIESLLEQHSLSIVSKGFDQISFTFVLERNQ